jgi:acetoin utilization deacetylase AcuC-like enzyme
MKIITDEQCAAYSAPGHPERPQRILGSLEKLRAQNELPIDWLEPLPAPDQAILRAHTEDHLKHLSDRAAFDADTPAYPQIAEHARRSVGAALHALKLARAGDAVFSLMRPPGHHATRSRAMGFCYLNNIAIAVLEALATGARKVAVLDFDVHHGNGTEEILLGRDDCLFCSVHQHPAYPGTGIRNRQNCLNFPVAPDSLAELYLESCESAFEEILKFQPDIIAVSAGFDAFRGDPLCQQRLEAKDFHWLGKAVRDLGRPSFSLLEGGYSRDLPDLILAYLRGLNGMDLWP